MVSLPSERSTRFGNPAWPGGRTANFAAFGSWPGVRQKDVESLRDSNALMRVAVPRLSAFFRSTSDQDPKAAKYAVLNPGHAGFPKRVERSEGSDTTPVRNTPVSACEPLCAIFLREPSVYPLSPVKANVGHLWEKLKNAIKDGLR